jgi:ABC-type nitrate/sulfonate/bicarbonate transport system substrate-binding protein
LTQPTLTRRRLIRGAAAFTAMPALAGLARAQTSEPLRFGFQNTSWGSIGMVAEAEDMFRKQGVSVSVNRFDSGKAVRDAMIANRIDIGVLGTTPMILGLVKGDVAPVAMAMYAGRTNAVVVGRNSGIKTIADLRGKKIGTQIGSSTDMVFVTKVLPRFGLAKGDVTLVNAKFENHVAALTGGSVDAFAGVEPFPSVAVTEGLGLSLIDYADFDLVPVWLGINTPVLEKRRDAVLGFLRAWVATIDIFKHTPDRAATIVQENFTKMGFTVSKAAISTMLGKLDANPAYVPQLEAYLREESQTLVTQRQIPAIPDWRPLLANPLVNQLKRG